MLIYVLRDAVHAIDIDIAASGGIRHDRDIPELAIACDRSDAREDHGYSDAAFFLV
jgi:hypothetical protein